MTVEKGKEGNSLCFPHGERRVVWGVWKHIFYSAWEVIIIIFCVVVFFFLFILFVLFLPRQGSWQCYYTGPCLPSEALFLGRKKKALRFRFSEKTLRWSLLCSPSLPISILPYCWLICLLTLQETYGQQKKKSRNTKWLLRARLEQ